MAYQQERIDQTLRIHRGCLFSVDGSTVLQNAVIRTFTSSHIGAHIFDINLVSFQQLRGKSFKIKFVSSLTKNLVFPKLA